MISYVVDEDGNKTYALVPINVWEKLKTDNYVTSMTEKDYPEYHLLNTINFLGSINRNSVDSWKKFYEGYFEYYNKLDVVDFIILYLFRSDKFLVVFDEEIEHADRMNEYDSFHEHFTIHSMQITKKDGTRIDWKLYTTIREKIGTISEQEFLTLFHSKLKFTDESIENFKHRYKRVHRSAERDRLFVYDLSILLMNNLEDIQKKERVLDELQNDVSQYLANNLYNGNLSQVYRAKKEAQEKIEYVSM
ncbi:hypothetical protein [Sulfurimonas sp.]|uniref:hypothetical protein n=1 Tax=Sulfurimonas sp. TaxID=2022749 RepID=UPI003568D5CF